MSRDPLRAFMQANGMARWAEMLPGQIERGLDARRYGDLPRWQAVLEALPAITPSALDLARDCLQIGQAGDIDAAQRASLIRELKKLHPWRKGPYELFGIHIDTEWRSDWKWQRLAPHLGSLAGQTVLDVGCGNGYHCWRMHGAGATRVIGIDPTPLFVMQFRLFRHFIGAAPVDVLPMGIDDVPQKMQAFDTVFSMGVLYHRRSPLDHLLQLRDCLRTGGQLVLETLVVEGDERTALIPEDRYGRMGNVWFLPSVAMLEIWLRRCRFRNIRCVDVNVTCTEEQRATEWMTFQSLADFLDPEDRSKTVEGYPAPRRAILIANAP